MATSQVVLHLKNSVKFSYANYSDKKSEFLLPMKKTISFSRSLSNFVLSEHKKGYWVCKKSRTSCNSEGTFFSDERRSSGLPDTASSSVKIMEGIATTSISAIAPFKGLGIIDFMKGKNFLITGATGFVGKVLIEKILRMQPDVGNLFLIIRAEDSASALKRLKNEVVDTELFKGLREKYGNEFHKFISTKLVPVAGDMTQHNLGIEEEMGALLMKEVDIIVSSAANTTFDERYDVALETNTRGVCRLFEFGKRCKKLQLFTHLSTAYVYGQRQGRALEKPFRMGYTVAKEKVESAPPLNIEAEFHLASKARETFEIEFSNFATCKLNKGLDSQKKIAQRMRDLGMERARAYGWQDTYSFTKAMAEMLMASGGDDLPVVIVRPSVIESTYSQPFPGWIEGHRMLDPILTHFGKGQLSCLSADPDTLVDVVPVDMVVNATLAAIAKHAGISGLQIYHAASSIANPIRFKDIMKITFEHFRCNPYFDKKGKTVRLLKEMTCFPTMEDLCDQALDAAENMPQKQKNISLKSLVQAKYMSRVYEPYLFYKGRFDISNLEKLFQELSEEEKENFGFDVTKIEWRNYLGNIHMQGLRQHVMKGRGAGKRLVNICFQ